MNESNREWPLVPLWKLLKESRISGTTGAEARKITVKLYGKGAVPKVDRQGGSTQTKYYVRRAGQLIYGKLDFLNGAFAIIPQSLDGYESTQDLPAFDISPEADSRWLIRFLTQESFYKLFQGNAIGSRKARRVNPDEFLQTEVRLPPKQIQEKFAQIFDDVDKTINAGHGLLKQLQVLKRAAMHELLTCGIPGRHEAFQDTELGKIPVGWEIEPLRAVGSWGGGGTPSKARTEYWTTDGLPWVSPKDMRGPEVTNAEDHITMQAVRESSTNVYPEGTILLVARSGILRNTLPIAITRREVAINQDLKAILPGQHVSADFLYQILEYHAPRILKACVKAGTTVESLQTAALHDYRVILPPLKEQSEIVEILKSFDERIRVEQTRGRQLSKVKEALTQQLLTGQLRAPELEEVAGT